MSLKRSVQTCLGCLYFQSRPKPVEPIDFETFAVKNKVQLHNDPQRDMLNFPHDDVEVPVSLRRLLVVCQCVCVCVSLCVCVCV